MKNTLFLYQIRDVFDMAEQHINMHPDEGEGTHQQKVVDLVMNSVAIETFQRFKPKEG